jgi:hypothetical protein
VATIFRDLFAIYFLLVSCLAYNPEYRGGIFLRNAGLLSTDYTALYPRGQNSSYFLRFDFTQISVFVTWYSIKQWGNFTFYLNTLHYVGQIFNN